jgi:hypothetical protein
MAPEQITGGRLGPAADLYALGVVVYQLLTGAPPFDPALGTQALWQHHLHTTPAPPAGAPAPVAQVVLHALAKDPATRPTSAHAFAVELAIAAARAYRPGWVARSGLVLHLDDEVREAAESLPTPVLPAPAPRTPPRPAGDATADGSPSPGHDAAREDTADSPQEEAGPSDEALLTAWPPLDTAIGTHTAALHSARVVEQAAAEWVAAGRPDGFLWDEDRLTATLAALRPGPGGGGEPEIDLVGDAEAFLTASRSRAEAARHREEALRRQEKAHRRRRLRLRVLSIAIAVTLLGLAAWFGGRALQRASWRDEARELGRPVRLPAGMALVGPGDRRVFVDALRVESHEVTNRQYRLCVRGGACQPTIPAPPAATAGRDDADLPMVNVTPYWAADYCRWVGRRLPTVDEWIRTARGLHGRPYPWGSQDPTPDRANTLGEAEDSEPGGLAEVDDPAYRGGWTEEGVTHLLGNAREWTATVLRENGDVAGTWNMRDPAALLAVAGGSYMSTVEPVDSWIVPASTTEVLEINGFRCVADAD